MGTKLVIKELIYIVIIICVPLILLGFAILRNGKYKKQGIIISLLLLFIIYAFNAQKVVQSASKIITAFSMEKADSGVGTDITFLENYEQKMAKNNYLSQFDVKQIVEIADSKSKEISINYRDESSDINFKTINKNDDEMKKLKEMLKSDYYIFDFIADKNKIEINIERYIIEENNNKEKNNIVLAGNKNAEIVECINKYYVSDEASNFTFENKLKAIYDDISNKKLRSFKMLLVYNNGNYIPVIDDLKEYELIDSYKVYSTGIQVTLKDGVTLENKDYTLRLNRYNDNLEITKGYYYYEYEPIVTELKNSSGNVILEMKFDKIYSISELKNIEIIFQ